jgi:hypothetical protein
MTDRDRKPAIHAATGAKPITKRLREATKSLQTRVGV